MKFLVMTTSMPDKNTIRNQYFKSIHNELNQKINCEIIWVICQPNKIINSSDKFSHIVDIHTFPNALKLLQSLKPDVIIVNIGIEPIQYSFSLAADHLKIPIISFAGSTIPTFFTSEKGTYHTFRRFFLSGVPTDTENEKYFLRRGKFMIYKLLFLLKTQISLKINFVQIIKEFFQDLIIFNFNKKPRTNFLANLVLVHFESQIQLLKNLGFKKEKLILIGHPLLDQLNNNFVISKNPKINSNKIKLLIVTDTLYEHGIWTFNQRNSFLTSMFSKLSEITNIEFSLKIHPAQENKSFYENLLKNLNFNAEILQSENLQSILPNYDLVLSFGASTTHTETSFSGKRLIILETNTNLGLFPLVDEGIQSGHVLLCKNMDNLNNMINNFIRQDVLVSEKFIQDCKKLFYKNDGKSAERGANTILNLINEG